MNPGKQNGIKMLFIVGSSRSGTTMLGRMLGKSDSVYKLPELHLFGSCIPYGKEFEPAGQAEALKIFTWLCDVADRKFHAERRPGLYRKEAEALLNKHYSEGKNAWDYYQDFVLYESNKHGKTIPCEDLPSHVFQLDKLIHQFPEARFVHVIRDARDVLLSQKNRRNRKKMGAEFLSGKALLRYRMNYHPVLISKLWNSAVNTGLSISHPHVLHIHFETLLNNPEETLKTICEHCGVIYNPEMLQVPQVGSSSRPDNVLKTGIDKSRSGAWQLGGLSDTEIYICERINEKLLENLGYPLSGTRANLFKLALSLMVLPIKVLVTFFLNLERTKGRWKFLRQRFLLKRS